MTDIPKLRSSVPGSAAQARPLAGEAVDLGSHGRVLYSIFLNGRARHWSPQAREDSIKRAEGRERRRKKGESEPGPEHAEAAKRPRALRSRKP